MQLSQNDSGPGVESGPLIDCDVHLAVPNVQALYPYLSAYWVENVKQSQFKGVNVQYYPPRSPVAARQDSTPADGPPGSSLDLLRRQVLDPLGVDLAVSNCLYAIDSLHNPEAAVAFARAANDWQVAEWLEKEPRLKASIVVPVQLPELAAAEIERAAAHPGFVQVLLPARSEHPYGNRIFRPMWEAIAKHNLVAGIHFGGAPGNPPFPSGWPSYYFEEYAGMGQVFQSQLVSIVSEGVLDLFPNVRIALLESGFTWMPAFMWRFDKEWKNLRRLVPWVKRPPSEYIREHVRLTVQPIDAPPHWEQLQATIDQLGGDQLLLFASDYPHRHVSDPLEVLLPRLSASLARKIRGENAHAFYGFSSLPAHAG